MHDQDIPTSLASCEISRKNYISENDRLVYNNNRPWKTQEFAIHSMACKESIKYSQNMPSEQIDLMQPKVQTYDLRRNTKINS